MAPRISVRTPQLSALIVQMRAHTEAADLEVDADVHDPWLSLSLADDEDFVVHWPEAGVFLPRLETSRTLSTQTGSSAPLRHLQSAAFASLQQKLRQMLFLVPPSLHADFTGLVFDRGIRSLARQVAAAPDRWEPATVAGAVELATLAFAQPPPAPAPIRPLLESLLILLPHAPSQAGPRLSQTLENHLSVPDWQAIADLVGRLPPSPDTGVGFDDGQSPLISLHLPTEERLPAGPLRLYRQESDLYVVAPRPSVGAWLSAVTKGLVGA